MKEYLEFKKARCKDCYKCLRECPVKAIEVKNHQAQIIKERCILCGRCTVVCPQNAKIVHSEKDEVDSLLSFISSFRLKNFAQMETVLYKLGFAYAEETAVGANAVTKEYARCMASGDFPNFITSACPALCRLMTFEDLRRFMIERGVTFPLPDAVDEFEAFSCTGITGDGVANRSKSYPIRRGIIHSFEERPEGYDYVAVDGPQNCVNDKVSGVFFEMNMCENACVSGPCSMVDDGEEVRAAVEVKRYVREECAALPREQEGDRSYDVDISAAYPRIEGRSMTPTQEQIEEILHRTGKFKPEDELNCGSCGYPTCREKAWAVFNGYADIDICLPYMRERAESMSYEIIHNSPEGIVVLDSEMNVVDINSKAKELLGITAVNLKGLPAIDFFNPTEFLIAQNSGRQYVRKKIYVAETKRHIEMSISILKGNHALFGILKDITEEVHYNEKFGKMRMETLATTDDVIKKQMRVAQEIASLLGETTAETKVALLKLKKTLMQEEEERERSEKS